MKKILSIALTLIFCCMGIFAFSGCQERKDYVICVEKYPTMCYKYNKDDYKFVYEYKENVFKDMVVTCYNADKTELLWTTAEKSCLEALREHNGWIDGWNGEYVGRQTVRVGIANCYVSFTFVVLSPDDTTELQGAKDGPLMSDGTSAKPEIK